MKIKKFCFLLMLTVFSISLFACNKQEKQYAVATFMLEGGICDNNKEKITYKYDIEEGQYTYLLDPTDSKYFNKDEIERYQYTLVGWYQTKTGEGEDAIYSDPWDFTKDKMGYEGVTLYAKWKKDVIYTFSLVTTSFGEEQLIEAIEVNQNGSVTERFLDGKANRHKFTDANGQEFKATVLGYVDSLGNPWDFNFKHPGGDTDTDIKIYANFIKGEYDLVSTYEDLRSATKDIYLLNDIDCEGNTLTFRNFKGKTLEGNGYTISNFKLNTSISGDGIDVDGDGVSKEKIMGLFDDLSGSTIRNITFSNVMATLDFTIPYTKVDHIFFTPFAYISDDTTIIENVNVTGKYYLYPDNAIECTIIENSIYSSTKTYDTLVVSFTAAENDFE